MTSAKQHIVSIMALCAAFTFTEVGIDHVRAEESSGPAMVWFDKDYPYRVVDQALPDALREFGHNLDIAVEVSASIKGRVRRYDHEGSSGDFLKYLASEHHLQWVFDRERLYISSADEQIDRHWSAGAGAVETVETALDSAGIHDPRFPIGFDAGQAAISLSAPPRYMALAAPVIDRVLTPKATRTVNVIHGRTRGGGT